MTILEITVISVVIIFGFAAWLIARKRGADEWQKAYAKKLADQHDAGTQAARRLTQWRNRAKVYKVVLDDELKRKRGGIGAARKAYNEAVAEVLKLEKLSGSNQYGGGQPS